MITYKIHLIRTGRTSANPWKRYVGQADYPLCDQGIEALHGMVREFDYPKVQMVYTSPLQRCVQTSDILYPDTYTVPVDGLMDMNLGTFEGKSFDELKGDEAFGNWLKNSFEHSPPGGEKTADFTQRIVQTLNDIFRNMMDEKMTSVAVVTHGGVIMTLLSAVGLPRLPLHQWAVDNATGYTILMTPQLWMRDGVVEIFNHLPQSKIEDDMDVYGMYYNE